MKRVCGVFLWLPVLLGLVLGMALSPVAAGERAARVLELVRDNALTQPSAEAVTAFSTRADSDSPSAIREFLATFDPWGAWVDAEEHAESTRLRKALGSGVGLDMVRNRAGELVCLPYPGSPAEQAGVREGDTLLAVDGFSAAGADLNDLLVLVLGKAGTVVNHRWSMTTFRIL